MDSDRLNRWLSLGANTGVLVGIVFLAVEIRQNSDLARLQFAEDRQNTWQQGEMVVFGDSIAAVWEKSVLDPESLSLAETRMLDAYLAFQLTNASRVLELEKAGLMPTGATEQQLRDSLPFFFDTEFAKVWWEIEGRTWEPELVKLAEPIIREIAKDQSVIKLQKIRHEAASRVNGAQ
jgi:hypothetical protein